MVITKISANGFKNLKKVEIYPHEKMNIFCGKNAQGKTNLIEAIWLCSGVRSFRNTRDREMIDINGQVMNIDISFKNSFRSQDIHFAMARPNVREKNVTLNGVKLKTPSKLFGSLDCVIFTPEDLERSFLCLQILSYSLKSDIFLSSLAISSARQDICVRLYISH